MVPKLSGTVASKAYIDCSKRRGRSARIFLAMRSQLCSRMTNVYAASAAIALSVISSLLADLTVKVSTPTLAARRAATSRKMKVCEVAGY